MDKDYEKRNIVDYPSALLLLDHCFLDYQRLQVSFKHMYDKIKIILILTSAIIMGSLIGLEISPVVSNIYKNNDSAESIVLPIKSACIFIGILLMIVSIIYLLRILRGIKIPVLKSEDLRVNEFLKEKEEYVAVWLIDKYTRIISESRLLLQRMRQQFNTVIGMVIIGLIMITIAVILKYIGF